MRHVNRSGSWMYTTEPIKAFGLTVMGEGTDYIRVHPDVDVKEEEGRQIISSPFMVKKTKEKGTVCIIPADPGVEDGRCLLFLDRAVREEGTTIRSIHEKSTAKIVKKQLFIGHKMVSIVALFNRADELVLLRDREDGKERFVDVFRWNGVGFDQSSHSEEDWLKLRELDDFDAEGEIL